MATTLTVIYGGFSVGAGTDYTIDGNWRWDVDYTQGRLQFTIVVKASDAADLEENCASLEAAFRTPWQDLKLTMAGEDFLDYSHSAGTGFSGQATISKTGTQTDTTLSREYSVTVTVFFPADLSGQAGRRSASVGISATPADRLTVAFAGEWTTIGSGGALANYYTNSKTWATGYLASKFSDRAFELLTDQVTPDDQDKVASFTMVYQEIIYNQSAGVLNDPELVDEQVTFSVSRETPGDSPGSSLAASLGLGGGGAVSSGARTAVRGVSTGNSSRPYGVTAAISASVDKNTTTDLDNVWTTKLRPYVISQLTVATGVGGVIAIVSQNYEPDYANNTISGSVTAVVSQGGLLSYEVSLAYNEQTGTEPVWAHGDTASSAYVVQRQRVLSRVVTTSYRTLAGGGSGSGNAGGAPVAGGGGGAARIGGGGPGGSGGIAAAASQILGQINATFEDILGDFSGGGSMGGVGTDSPNVNEQGGGGGAGRGGGGSGGEEFGLDFGGDNLSWVTTERGGSSTPRILGDPALGSFKVIDFNRSATQKAFTPIRIKRVPITQAGRNRSTRGRR